MRVEHIKTVTFTVPIPSELSIHTYVLYNDDGYPIGEKEIVESEISTNVQYYSFWKSTDRDTIKKSFEEMEE